MSSEFEIIQRYFTHRTQHTLLGVGDDAALIRARAGHDLAVSTDTLTVGTHFFSNADPRLLGQKALAVSLSDMAAMGATPRWATLALTLPRVNEKWLAAFAQGFMTLARHSSVDLIGGDTTRGPLAVTVQIIGEVPRGRSLRRNGARVGDQVWVSGTIGDAALALAALQSRSPVSVAELEHCAKRLHQPTARVSLGLGLRGIASSAIDISDGLLADLGHILERSSVAAHIEYADIPCSATLRARLGTPIGRYALLAGGDDYELCFTAPRRAHTRVVAAARRAKVKVTVIGSIEKRQRNWPNLVVFDNTGKPLKTDAAGYDHFR